MDKHYNEEALRLLMEDYTKRGVPMPAPRAFVEQTA